jgi:hypothetical protein
MKEYINIYDTIDGYRRVVIDDKWGFIDINDNEICACKYDWVDNFKNDYAIVSNGDNWGFINRTGNEMIPCIYEITLAHELLNNYKLNKIRIQKLKTII